MKLTIGEVIHRLRKEKGITQEELGNTLGVSIAAVSKWETGAAYPDITMLPIIARYFQTTIDEIMNYAMELSEEQVMAINEECTKLLTSGAFEEGIGQCESYLRQYPSHDFLKFRIASLYMMHLGLAGTEEKMKKLLDRTTKLFEETTNSKNTEVQNGSYYVLSSLYMMNEEDEKAIEALKKVPRTDFNPDMILASIYAKQGKEEEAKKLNQQVLAKSFNEVIAILESMAYSKLKKEDYEGTIELLHKQKQLIGTLGLEALYAMSNSSIFMEVYARQKKVDETIKYFEQYRDAILGLKDMNQYTQGNELIDTLDYDNHSISMETIKHNTLFSVEMNKELDFVREDSRFKEIIQSLR